MLLTTGRPVLRRRRTARRRRPRGKPTCIVHSRPRCWRRDGHHEAATTASLTKSALPRHRGQSGYAPSPCRLTTPMHPARRPLPQRLLHEARACHSFRRGPAQIRPIATVHGPAPSSRPEPCLNAPRTSRWPRPRSWPVRSVLALAPMAATAPAAAPLLMGPRGGAISGERLVPCSWRNPPHSGPLLLAGDTVAGRSNGPSPPAGSAMPVLMRRCRGCAGRPAPVGRRAPYMIASHSRTELSTTSGGAATTACAQRGGRRGPPFTAPSVTPSRAD